MTDALKDKYYSDDLQKRIASRKARELASFYEADSNTIFVAMEGKRVLALVDDIGENYFEGEKEFGHRRRGKWHLFFDNDMNLDKPFTEPVYHKGIDTGFSLNRIIFGAPGTGKSYGLEQDRKAILQEGGETAQG